MGRTGDLSVSGDTAERVRTSCDGDRAVLWSSALGITLHTMKALYVPSPSSHNIKKYIDEIKQSTQRSVKSKHYSSIYPNSPV
jgi:hypothetical protein